MVQIHVNTHREVTATYIVFIATKRTEPPSNRLESDGKYSRVWEKRLTRQVRA